MAEEVREGLSPAASGTVGPPAANGGNGNGRRKPRRLLLILGPLVLVGAAYGGYRYWWGLTHEETEDAQVEGHIHAMAAKVSGYVAEVVITDNQVVAAGDVLIRIRPDDYEAAVAQAAAALAQAQADAQVAEHNLAVLRGTTAAAITQAEAGVQEAQARVEAARKDADSAASKLVAAQAAREQTQAETDAAQADADYAAYNLHKVKLLSEQSQASEDEVQLAEAQQRAAAAKLAAAREAVRLATAQIEAAEHGVAAAQAAVAVAQAGVGAAQGALDEAQTGPNQVRVAEARITQTQAGVQAAEAALELARLNLSYCTITAPTAGVVSKRSVEVGQFLAPGQAFLAIVPLDETWVVANFKETELRNMRAGQPAELAVDAYPDHIFRGHVDSLAAGTGARFSLLPPENATGNYVKVVQRVPVKLVLDDGQRDPQRPLRPGMNVVVTVDTGATPAATAP